MALALLVLGMPLCAEAAETTSARQRFELQRDLAHALEQTGRSAEALELYKELIRDPQASEAERYQLTKRLAYALAATGDHRRAAATFDGLLASPALLPADAVALRTALAHSLQHSGHHRRAVWQWQRVLDDLADGDPEITRIQLRMADLFEKLDQDPAAAAIYANLLGTELDDDNLRFRFAWLHNRHRRFGEAWALLEGWPRPHPRAERLRLQAQTAFWAEADEAALALYPALLKQVAQGSDTHVQYAELLRRNGRMQEAAELLAGLVAGTPADRQLRTRLVETYLETRDSRAAVPHLQVLLQDGRADPQVQLLAARVYADRQQPARAVRHLKRLSRLQKLSPEHQVWLADLLRAVGQNEEARSAYATAIGHFPRQTPPRAWVALADMAFDDGDHALALAHYSAALDRLPEADGRRAALQLKIARSASRLNQRDRANAAYARYLAATPTDREVWLEVARTLSAQGAHEAAAAHYRRVVTEWPEADIAMEAARAFMAAGAYPEAEAHARKALAAHPADPEAVAHEPRLLLAEVLLYSGQTAAADQLVAAYLEDYPEDPRAILLQAETALARDRRLLAFTRFGEVRLAGVDESERISTGRGQSALRRGDHLRASREIEALAAGSASGEAAATLIEDYQLTTAPRLGPLAGWSSDSNDLVIRHLGLGASAGGPRHLPLDLRYVIGWVEQEDTDFQRQAVSLGTRPYFIAPNLSAEGYLGIEALGDTDREQGATLPIGEVVVRRYWMDDSSLGVGLSRETLWTRHDSLDLHRYHRVTDLAAVEPAFARTDLRLLLDKRLGDGGRFWQTAIGGDRYSDDNARLWAYTHLQQPLVERPGRWLAVKPNGYYEGFSNNEAAYFSPDNHLSLGLILQGVERRGSLALDLEVNPQLLITDGEAGWGGHWHLKLTAERRHLFAGGGIFGFYDHNDDYLLWRMLGQVGGRF